MKSLLSSRPKAAPTLPMNLALDALSLTRAAAVACYEWIGMGQEKTADQAAVTAMRQEFNNINIDGTIVIGEGERDAAPMLYIGEKLGKGNVKVDIAVDPLEGTTLCAHSLPNSISVLAFSTEGGLLNAPDVYMDKIAIGPGYPEGLVDLDNTPLKNIQNLAKAKKCDISDITISVLKRPRHDELVAKIREAGARIQFIADGDVLAVISATLPDPKVDMYMGMGGAPEGVLAAAALRCLGGQMQGRLIFREDAERKRAVLIGVKDFNKKYSLMELAKGDVIFAATGVTDGWYLQGVKYSKKYTCTTNSVVMESANKTLQFITHTAKI
jgi:fructose-1,6-bisphosphatase II / sedoheptulose-1,7-bisphosphatase